MTELKSPSPNQAASESTPVKTRKPLQWNNTSFWLVLILLLAYWWPWHRPNWNDLGRYDLIMSVVHQGTVQIDSFHTNTGDKAVYNGHYYSDKAPGPAFLGIPVYMVMTWVEKLTGVAQTVGDGWYELVWYAKLFGVRMAVVGLPSALFGLLLWRYYLRVRDKDSRYALALALIYSLGTLAFPYSTLFYGHAFSAVLLFSAFILLEGNNDLRLGKFFSGSAGLVLSGFLAGYAVISEFPVVLLAGLLTLYLFWKEKSPVKWAYFIGGAMVPLVIILLYNHATTGSFFRVGYFSVAGEEFRKEMSHGIAGVTYPKLSALWGMSFSLYRGIFLLNPILLLAFPAWVYWYRAGNNRKQWWLSVAVVSVFVLFNASYYMWWGGWSLGPRHFIPALPFMLLPLIYLPDKWKPAVYTLGILSVAFMFIGTAVDPQIPDNNMNPFFGYALSHFLTGKVSANWGILLGSGLSFGVWTWIVLVMSGVACLLYKTKD